MVSSLTPVPAQPQQRVALATELPGARQVVPARIVQAAPAKPQPAAANPKPQQVAAAAPTPAPPKPQPAAAKPQHLAMAAPPPALRPNIGEAVAGAASAPGRNWTIQIGAFGDRALAEAQLNSYAAKAKDILGEAAHIVTPSQSSGGHMLYRARFGPYVEREARDVCGQLTQRIGPQSCFPVVTR